jgi:uncharacterized membrane protein YbhN (UPF0104 family)
MVKKYRKIFLATLSTLVLSYFLFREIALTDIFRAFHCFSIASLGIILFWFFLIFLTDTVRYRILLFDGEQKSLKKLFSVITGGNLLLNLLPFRSGELSYIFFMNRALNVSKTQCTLVVAIMRTFDMIALLILFSFALFNTENLPDPLHNQFLKGASLILLLVSLTILFLIMAQYHALKKLVESFLLKFLKGSVREKISTALTTGYHYTKNYGNRYTLLFVGTLSLLYWLLRYLLGFFLVRTLGISIGIWEMFLISSLLMFSVLIPIQGIGDLGVFEAKWTFLFMLFGVGKEVAITSGLAFHMVLFSITVLFGIYGLFQMSTRYKSGDQGNKTP